MDLIESKFRKVSSTLTYHPKHLVILYNSNSDLLILHGPKDLLNNFPGVKNLSENGQQSQYTGFTNTVDISLKVHLSESELKPSKAAVFPFPYSFPNHSHYQKCVQGINISGRIFGVDFLKHQLRVRKHMKTAIYLLSVADFQALNFVCMKALNRFKVSELNDTMQSLQYNKQVSQHQACQRIFSLFLAYTQTQDSYYLQSLSTAQGFA